MKSTISLRDCQKLSEYLDHELPEKEARQLEARLDKDPILRGELNDLEQVRRILRSQPVMRAPRSFTLTPAMLGKPAARQAQFFSYPVLRVASLVAVVLLLFILVGDAFYSASFLSAATRPEFMIQEEVESFAGQEEAAGLSETEMEGARQQEDMQSPEPVKAPPAEKALMKSGPAEPTSVTIFSEESQALESSQAGSASGDSLSQSDSSEMAQPTQATAGEEAGVQAIVQVERGSLWERFITHFFMVPLRPWLIGIEIIVAAAALGLGLAAYKKRMLH